MDWLSKYDGVIQCARKAVKLTKKDGTSVEFVTMVQSGPDSKLNHTKAIALEDIRVVQDFPDVFLWTQGSFCNEQVFILLNM
jgi:hypothetical protein